MGFIKSTVNNALQFSVVKHLLIASGVSVLMGTVALNVNATSDQADAATSHVTCKSPNTGKVINLSKDKFEPVSITVNGNKAVASFKFPGQCEGQNIPISFVSYKAPNTPGNQPFSQQVLFDSVTRNYSQPRNGAQITINVPDCKYQLDLVVGQPITQFSDGHASANTYTGQKRMITASGGGSGECFAQPAPTPDPTPTPEPIPSPEPAPATVTNIDNSNTNTNTNTIENTVEVTSPAPTPSPAPAPEPEEEPEVDTEVKKEEVTTTVAASPAPSPEPTPAPVSGKGESAKELPDTGPGLVAAVGFGTTFMSSFLYSARSRYAEILAKIVSRL